MSHKLHTLVFLLCYENTKLTFIMTIFCFETVKYALFFAKKKVQPKRLLVGYIGETNIMFVLCD